MPLISPQVHLGLLSQALSSIWVISDLTQYAISGVLRVQRLPAWKGIFPLSFASHASFTVWDRVVSAQYHLPLKARPKSRFIGTQILSIAPINSLRVWMYRLGGFSFVFWFLCRNVFIHGKVPFSGTQILWCQVYKTHRVRWLRAHVLSPPFITAIRHCNAIYHNLSSHIPGAPSLVLCHHRCWFADRQSQCHIVLGPSLTLYAPSYLRPDMLGIGNWGWLPLFA